MDINHQISQAIYNGDPQKLLELNSQFSKEQFDEDFENKFRNTNESYFRFLVDQTDKIGEQKSIELLQVLIHIYGVEQITVK